GCFDALQNPGKVTAIATHAPEHDLVQAVEADRNAVEAGLCEVRSVTCEQGPVGRKCEILHAVYAPECPHEIREPAIQQRLTAGQPELCDAETHGSRSDPLD